MDDAQVLAVVAGESAALAVQFGVFAFLYLVRIWRSRHVYWPANWRRLSLEEKLVPAFVLGATPFLLHALWQRSRSAWAFAHGQWRILPIDVPGIFFLLAVIAGMSLLLWSALIRVFGPHRGLAAWRAVNLAAFLFGVEVWLSSHS